MPVRDLVWLNNKGILVTGGWDSKIRFWDLRSPNPILDMQILGPVSINAYNNEL